MVNLNGKKLSDKKDALAWVSMMARLVTDPCLTHGPHIRVLDKSTLRFSTARLGLAQGP